LSVKSINDFIEIYQKKRDLLHKHDNDLDEFNLKDLLSQTIISYINNLTYQSKLAISNDIIAKFAESKSNERLRSGRVLYNFYAKFKRQNEKVVAHDKFRRWKATCLLEVLRTPSLHLTQDHSRIPQFSDIKSHDNSVIACKKIPIRETLDEKRLNDDIKNCTFKPKINNYKFMTLERDSSPYERLYNHHEIYKNRRNLRNKALDEREAKRLSFSPDMSKTKHRNAQSDGFFKRQVKYKEQKERNDSSIRSEIEDSNRKTYTFRPIVNNKSMELAKDDENSFRGIRLYNLSSQKRVNTSCDEKSSSPVKQVDYRRIEQLYNDYKKSNNSLKKLTDEVSKEEGLTFKPKISTKFLPTNTVEERNAKFLEDKKSFRENYYKKEESEEKRVPRVISSQIIDRLYNKSMDKVVQKKQAEERQKFDFKTTLRHDSKKNIKEKNFVFTFSERKPSAMPSKRLSNEIDLRISNPELERVQTIVHDPYEDYDYRIKKPMSKTSKPTLDSDREIGKHSISKNYTPSKLVAVETAR
jgi:hypothetical protein